MRPALLAFMITLLTAWSAFSDVLLEFEGLARETFFETKEFVSYKMPTGPFADGIVPTVVAEGKLRKSAWHITAPSGGNTLAAMDALRQQLEAAGFELLYECETGECGGFDFRFSTDVIPEPKMHIDIGDFRYLAAQRLGASVPEYISLFVSRSSDFVYVQMILVGGTEDTPLPNTQTDENSLKATSLGEKLNTAGSVVLTDLNFTAGSEELEQDFYASIKELAAYLTANPGFRVALVGHTDTDGTLSKNIILSRQRAETVEAILINDYGIDRTRIEASGVGYLAPRASNLTAEGRRLNRRVEVVLTSTQ